MRDRRSSQYRASSFGFFAYEKGVRVRPPSRGAVSVLLAILGAAVYLTTVLFALGDGGLSLSADETAGRVSLTIAAALSGVAFLVALAGLGDRGARGGALVGLFLSLAFAFFSGLSLWRTF